MNAPNTPPQSSRPSTRPPPAHRKKLISIITPCYNEEANAEAMYRAIKDLFARMPQYDYEHIFADNASTDRTLEILRGLAAADKNVRVIANARNFGHIRSPFHASMQSRGDAMIGIVCDFQDPPELIPQMLQHWEEGYEVVAPVKRASKESRLMWLVRQVYYKTLARLSDVELIDNLAGYCLYDRKIVDLLRDAPEPQPYVRGLISEYGARLKTLDYVQPDRRAGKSKNNFLVLFDFAMAGLTSHSKAPMRLATLAGMALGTLAFLFAILFLVMKLVYWDRFDAGQAPLLIGVFFFSSVQLFFTGLIGEYIASIHAMTLRRPRVVERERINFEEQPPKGPQP